MSSYEEILNNIVEDIKNAMYDEKDILSLEFMLKMESYIGRIESISQSIGKVEEMIKNYKKYAE